MLLYWKARVCSHHHLLGRICASMLLPQCHPGTSVACRAQRQDIAFKVSASTSTCITSRRYGVQSSTVALAYAEPHHSMQSWALVGHIRMQQSTTRTSQCVCLAMNQRGMASEAGAKQLVQQPTAQAPKSLEQLQQMTFPADLPAAFHFFLMTLYANGHFGDDRRENIQEIFEDVPAVKRALLDVARIRADIIYRLRGEDLSALAEAELPEDKKTVERKIRNASKRLQEWHHVSQEQAAAAFQSTGQLQKVLQPFETEKQPPSLQDLLRIIWCWNTVAYPHLKKTSPEGEKAIVNILHQTLIAYFSQPDPAHVAKAQSLQTITAEQKAEMLARMAETEEQKKALVTNADRIRYEKSLKTAQVPLQVGDWRCICNVFNFKGRQACWRCKHPVTGNGVITVTVEDMMKKYGPYPKTWPKREGNRWLKHPGQPEDIRAEYRAKRDAVLMDRRAAKAARTAKRQAAMAARAAAEAAGELPPRKPPLLASKIETGPRKTMAPRADRSDGDRFDRSDRDMPGRSRLPQPGDSYQRRTYTTTARERDDRTVNEPRTQPAPRKRFADLLDADDLISSDDTQ